MSFPQVLASLTTAPADRFAPSEKTGRIAPGFQADLTVFAKLTDVRYTLRAGQISEHDQKIGTKLAHILCGGDLSSLHFLSEQYILDLEREVFLSLCGEPKTVERIQHTLRTGKPLRN